MDEIQHVKYMDDTDVALVLSLLESPDISNKDLAAKVNVSPATASRRVSKLMERGILRNKSLLPNFTQIGLITCSFIIEPEEPFIKNSLILHLFFHNHAHTGHRNSVYGNLNGLFVQLILSNAEDVTGMLERFLDELVQLNIVRTYQLFISEYESKYYAIDTSQYNMQTREFVIDYSRIRKVMRSDFDELKLDRIGRTLPQDLTQQDIRIITAMFYNASRSLAEIGEIVDGMSKQDVSRRLKKINISDWQYRTPYDREQFGVFNQVLYVLNSDNNALASLNEALNIFPFPATVIPTKDKLLMWINLPAVDVTRFTDILKEKFTQVDLYLMGRRSRTYPPWFKNLENGRWRLTAESLNHASYPGTGVIHVSKFIQELQGKDLQELELNPFGQGQG